MNKIWKSELNAINKSIRHNSFATLIITPTIGILDWTKQEIKKLDITRKILTMNRSFHQSSDINCLYAKCKDRGRGIKSIEDPYECRTISLMEHLEKAGDTHGLLNLVKDHERSGIVRLGYKFKEQIKEIRWRHEVKLLSLAAFCEKRCSIILCGSKMPSFSHVYTRYQLMY